MKFAQIAYRNAPDEPVDIALYVNTVSRLACGMLRTDAVEVFGGITSKPAALALAKSLGARVV